jgi:hypothetical protein
MQDYLRFAGSPIDPGSSERDTRDAQNFRLAIGSVLAISLACGVYASIVARGLYHDGVAILFRVAEREGFVIVQTSRATTQTLLQAPIVLLSKFTSLSLFQRGQVFTFTLLMLPTFLCALCWFVAPRDRKAWVLFPVTYLLTGFSATSFHAIGEAATATSYYWLLLFVFLFRTASITSRLLFLLLCAPVFQLQEGAFPLTIVMMFACLMRASATNDTRERRFIAVCAAVFAAILACQIRWIIYPPYPAHREEAFQGLINFGFLYHDGHINLPLVTGAVALAAIAATIFTRFNSRPVVWSWVLFAAAATAAAIFIEQCFAPFAQLVARYHPILFGTILATVAIPLFYLRLPERRLMQPATMIVLVSLCVAQTAAEIDASYRWHAFAVDLQSRLGAARGLIPWETMLHTGDERTDINWRLMAAEWTIPFASVVFAPTNDIASMIDLPTGAYRSLDPEKPDQLPALRGISYEPYRTFFLTQKSAARP